MTTFAPKYKYTTIITALCCAYIDAV